MWTFIFLLVFQGISGGVAGYITNKYAVNMLFKEYTPLKLGGVIKKKKEKFIEEISELVERDIINGETLKKELSDKKFNIYLKKISENFFKEPLKDSFGNIKLMEADDFSNSFIKSEDFIRKNLNMIMPEFIDNISGNISLQNIFTEKQITKIVSSIYELLTAELDNDNTLEEFVHSFYKENSKVTISDIISNELQDKLINNIIKSVLRIIKEDILDDEEACTEFFNRICSELNIDLTLTKLQELIGNYQVSKFLTDSEQREFTSKLFIKVNEFVNSEKGKDLIEKLMKEIFLNLKEIDITVYEILPTEMKEPLINFIERVVPRAMPYISEWISGNEAALDEMIEEAIDEAIEDVDGNIKKLIMLKVRNALMGDISSKNNIVNKIINYLNENINGDSYEKLADSIIKYLRETKIKDIAALLENKDLLDGEKLSAFIIKEFGLHGESLLKTFIKTQFSKKINSFIDIDFVKLFNSNLKPRIYSNIFINKDKIIEKFGGVIKDLITLKSQEIRNKNLSQLFREDEVSKVSNKFSKIISKILRNNQNMFKPKIEEIISLKIKKADILGIINEHKVDISEFIVDNSIAAYKETVDKFKDYELKELINTYFHKNRLSNIIVNKGYPKLISKLPSLLNGNIKKFAKNNLSKYNEDEICNIVQEFMGNQLKPLSIFGAVLGTIVGVIYQLVAPNSIGWYGFPNSVVGGVTSLIVMAFIGYITNVIALWMIFHPYKENRIVAKIPFFKKFALGYIPAHKKEFSIGMAKLIDEELLNKEEINKSFNSHRKDMQSTLMTLATNNNYQFLIAFIRNKKKDLANYIYKKVLDYSSKDFLLGKRISQGLGGEKFIKFIKKNSLSGRAPKLINELRNIEAIITRFAKSKLSENHRVNDILPETFSLSIENYVKDQISLIINYKIQDAKNIDYIVKAAYDYDGYYNLQIQKSLREILNKEALDNLKNNMGINFQIYIFNDFKIYIGNFAKEYLRIGLEEDTNIGVMFNGKIKSFIDNNLYSLAEYLTKKLIGYLKIKEYDIALGVQEAIKNELNFFEQMAYGAFGGDDIARRVVAIILNEKLPLLIKEEIYKVATIGKATLEESIYPIETSTLKIKGDELKASMLLDNVFKKFSNNINGKQILNNAFTMILDTVISTPIVEYLELCNLHSLDLVYNKFQNEIIFIKEDIYNAMKFNTDNLSKVIGEFSNKKIVKQLFNSYNSEIFKEITFEEIRDSIRNTLDLICQSTETEKYLTIFLEKFYDNAFSEVKIGQIIDTDILSEDSQKSIKLILENEEFNKLNMELIEKIIEVSVNNNLDFITKDTKNYFADKIIKTGILSIGDYISEILQELDLKKITNKQIELLNPKEIDILFNSFAGGFFRKLEFYGLFGFVFGINVGLSIILWAMDLKYTKASHIKSEIE